MATNERITTTSSQQDLDLSRIISSDDRPQQYGAGQASHAIEYQPPGKRNTSFLVYLPTMALVDAARMTDGHFEAEYKGQRNRNSCCPRKSVVSNPHHMQEIGQVHPISMTGTGTGTDTDTDTSRVQRRMEHKIRSLVRSNEYFDPQ